MDEEIKQLKDKLKEHLRIARIRGEKDKTIRLTPREMELIIISLINDLNE